ncbi:unnamed protein product [Haemonchus placei]|uniref:Retrovirus-related Pol polyprotein from transposon 17.6 n=1 Tax=Haemonchus placei TaxID=6290 RepID=A0A0N4VUG2_HAEPC|nr:unnamed protein product [Haemonchus placei]
MATPAVINTGRASILVANPTSKPEALYKGQHISSAVPLYRCSSSLCTIWSDQHRIGKVTHSHFAESNTTHDISPRIVDLSHAEVTDEQQEQLAALFYEFRDRISNDSYDLGSYEDSEIVNKTTTNSPTTRFRPPRIPVKFQKELDEHINKLLRAGRIVESDTPWVHNTVIVKKKDRSLRSYDVTIMYLKGSSNVVADALSRAANPQVRFQDDTPDADDIIEFPVNPTVTSMFGLLETWAYCIMFFHCFAVQVC